MALFDETGSVHRVDLDKFGLIGEDTTAHTTFTSGGTAKERLQDKFSLDSEDATGHSAYISAGSALQVLVNRFDLDGENGLSHTTYTSGGTTKKVSTTSLSLKTLAGVALDGTGFTAYSNSGTLTAIHELATPWSVADLFDSDGLPLLQWAQSNDFLFIAHPTSHPRQVTRADHADFSIEEFPNEGGPFLDENEEDAAIYVTGQTGVGSTVVLTSDAPLWSADHVGAMWRLRLKDDAVTTKWEPETAFTLGQEVTNGELYYRCTDAGTSGTEPPIHDVGDAWDGADISAVCRWRYIHNGRGDVIVTDFISAAQVQAVVISELPAGVVGVDNKTSRWNEGAWSDHQGFPRSVALHEGRLTWGGTDQEPLALDFSAANNLFGFNPVELNGTVTQQTAFRRALDGNNPIRWMRSTEKGLIIGTLAGEWQVAVEGTTGQGFGAATAVARQFSENGAAAIMPVRNGDSLLYPQRARKRIRDITFDINQAKLVTSDRNLRSDHIAEAGIVAMGYAEEPYRVTWCVLSDGKLAALTYNREPGVLVSAWHKHVIGGSFSTGDAVVESIAVIPNPDEEADDVWLSVKRTIDGDTVRFIEWMTRPLVEGEDIEDGIYMDAALTYEGSPVTNITGADHLEGQTVAVLADGVYTTKVISGGSFSVALSTAASTIHVGLYELRYVETVHLEASAKAPVNTKAKLKRVSKVQIEVVESAKAWVGTDADYMDQMVFDEFHDEDGAPRRITGLIEESINDDYAKRKFVRIEQREPYPFVVTSITPTFEVSE